MNTIISIPGDNTLQLRFESCKFGDRPETFIQTRYSVERLTDEGPVVLRTNIIDSTTETVNEWEGQLGAVIREALAEAILAHYQSSL